MPPRIISVFLLSVILLYACGPITTGVPDCLNEQVTCIGLVTERGDVKDNGLNQSAWDAIQQSLKNPTDEAFAIESTDSRDHQKNITYFADSGYKIITTTGYSIATETLKQAEKYTNTYFIGIDQTYDTSQDTLPENMVTVSFPEDQASFLAGALAAQVSTSKKIAAICGPDSLPYIWRYCEGFKAGAAHIDPAVEVTVRYHNDISLQKSLNDPQWAEEQVTDLIGNGVDVLFSVGGSTATRALISAAQKGALIIAAEQDPYTTLPRDSRKKLLTSALKLPKSKLLALLKSIRQDKFPGGQVFIGEIGLGPYHEQTKRVTQQIQTQLDEIKKGLAEGSIPTNIPSEKPPE